MATVSSLHFYTTVFLSRKILRNPSFFICKKYLAQVFIVLRVITRGYIEWYRSYVYGIARDVTVYVTGSWDYILWHIHTLQDSILLPELNCASPFYARASLFCKNFSFFVADHLGDCLVRC